MIELLMVIAIIGLITSVFSFSFTNARKKSRDAKRIQDLGQIKKALDNYFDDHGHYPYVVGGFAHSNQVANWAILQTALSPYLPNLPVDPINNATQPWITGNYSYAYGQNIYDPPSGFVGYEGEYDLVAQLEDTESPYRCEKRCPAYYTGGNNRTWCGQATGACPTTVAGIPYNNSPYLYAP